MAGTVAVSQIQFDNGAGNTVTMMAPSSNQTYTFTLPSANTGALLVANNIVQLAAGSAGGPSVTANTDTASGLFFPAASTVAFSTASTERMRLDSSGNLQFNSGYGSVATAYGCRAWVNFNGTSTVAIRASGNVSSITDNGTGDYTVNFTNALTDANYVVLKSFGAAVSSYGYESTVLSQTTTSVNILTLGSSGTAVDRATVSVGILR